MIRLLVEDRSKEPFGSRVVDGRFRARIKDQKDVTLACSLFDTLADAQDWLKKQSETPNKLGDWQYSVLVQLNEGPFNPILYLENKAKGYANKYKKSLLSMEVSGLIRRSYSGYKGSVLYHISDEGKRFLGLYSHKFKDGSYWTRKQAGPVTKPPVSESVVWEASR